MLSSSLSLAIGTSPAKRVDGSAAAVVQNLLDGLDWTAGANTTLSIADGFARATRNGANPRIYKHVTDLSVGATYRLLGQGYKRTCTNIVLRAARSTKTSASNT